MDSIQANYRFNEVVNLKHGNNDQPRLFRPERFEHNERTDLPQTETYIREERTIVEPAPRDIRQRGPQQFSETYIRDAPQQDYSYEERRDSTVSNDSLLDAEAPSFVPQDAAAEQQVFGEHYWEQKQQPEREVPITVAAGTFCPEAEIPPAMAEFDMDRRCNREVAEFTRRPSRPFGRYVRDLVLWRNGKDSGVIFAGGLMLLLSLSYFSIISVIAYSSLSVLLLASGFVFLRQLVNTIQQKQGVHPFEPLLQRDVVIRPEYAHQQLDNILIPVNEVLIDLRNLYLADSLAQTLKLTFFMYILTYIGSWFNLLSLAMLAWVGAFTLPKMYMAYRMQIDSFFRMIREHVRDAQIRVSAIFDKQRNKLQGRARINSRAGQTEKKVTFKRVEEKREKVL